MKTIVFRNKKTGRLYRVITVGVDCTNSRDGTSVVIYCAVDDPQVYVREANEFQDKFEVVE